jgi:hypothetical protein
MTDSPTLSAELGPITATYRPPQQGRKFNLVAGVVVAIGGLIVGLIGLYLMLERYEASGLLGLLCLTLGVIFLPVGIWGYFITRRSDHDGVTVHENGLSIIHEGRHDTVFWDDIIEFFGTELERFSRNKFNFSRDKQESMGIFHYYHITTKDDRSFTFDDQLLNISELGDQIAETVMPRLRETIMADFDSGESIRFGPLRVDQTGLSSRKKKPVQWENVATFNIDWDRDRLFIEESNNPIKWGKFEMRQIGNLEILLEIAAQKLPDKFETTQKSA